MKKILLVLGLFLLGFTARAQTVSDLVSGVPSSTKSTETDAACGIKGVIPIGGSVTGTLGDSGTCPGGTPGSIFDFYNITVQAGQRVRVTFNLVPTSFAAVVVIQDYVTQAIVAQSSTNILLNSGSFEYTSVTASNYALGIGAYTGGTYTISLVDVTPPSTCTPSSTQLCLNNGRFAVVASFTANGTTAHATAVHLTGDTGYFWFFSSNNVEMTIKVVDGRAVNGKFWVFAAGMTNVEVNITVIDTQSVPFTAVKTYRNPQGVAFQPIQDTSAF